MWLLPVIVLLLGLLEWSRADTLVQLHVNRPYNDVNEKFVSFAVRPEDLYDALDGKNRKAVTNMATLLGDAHIKFVGDFYFASNAPTRLRNPTKIIWKGFNRWTRAVNWTMIIPVPYAPDEWDSMHTLKILNTSYMVGITDCIWQLGTDFGTSRAKDYVQELRTLKLMTDTFKPYVDDWRIMGADISAGSSADETKRYVDTSKDLNSAFGWTQPANMLPKSSLGSFLYDSDPALRILQQQRVPLWLSLPEERSSERLVGDETTDALRWAQTLGDAASTGFDVVFKRMTLQDFERPNFSLYVTALFKKVMGSRVFPARPLNVFSPSNKLYTHCANAVSGGLAFMVVNTEDQPTTITVRSPSRLAGKEIWQYVLTSLDERVQLNNVRLHLNSTLRPLIKENDASKQLQLITPSMSVGFWVLPDVNLEHCQFSEIEAEDEAPTIEDSSTEKRRSSRYSSADRLLQRLIEETAVARGAVQSSFNRNRRFVLDEGERPRNLLDRLMQTFRDTKPAKREALDSAIKSSHHSVNVPQALAWFNQVFEQAQGVNRRSRRSTSSYSGPYFYNRNGKKTAMTKKITEIRKPETKKKPLFDFDEFDEEKFFKKLGDQPEEPPAYTRLPEGDVHLKHIESIDGDENEPETEIVIPKKRKSKSKSQLKIIQREEEPDHDPEPEPTEKRRKLRLLPTEFFESLPAPKPNKGLNLGATLNSLLFPEPFSSKATIAKNNSEKPKPVEEPEEDVEPVPTARRRHSRTGHVASDFLQAQRELGKHFLSHINEHEHEFSLGDETLRESSLEANSAPKTSSSPDYFGAKESAPAIAPVQTKKTDMGITSWWDLPAMRRRRAIPMSNSLEEMGSNTIDNEDRDETMPLGGYTLYEYKVDQRPQINPIRRYEDSEDSTIMKISKTNAPPTEHRRISLADGIVTTVKAKVSRFINIVTQHMSEWYNTLTKHLDTNVEPPTRSLKENSIDK